MFGFSVALLY